MTPAPAGEQAPRGCIFTLLFKADDRRGFLYNKRPPPPLTSLRSQDVGPSAQGCEYSTLPLRGKLASLNLRFKHRIYFGPNVAVFFITNKTGLPLRPVLLRVCSFRHVLPSCFFLSDDAAELAYDEHYQQNQVEEAHQPGFFATHVFRLPFSSRPACRPWRNSCGCTNR